jgi:glycosyltransferase involved in cell wall biosynthesis
MELSAALMVWNERGRIERCLDALAFCDEIIVVDDGSSDGTWEYLQERAKRSNGTLIVHQHRHTTFAAQRALAKSLTHGRWVLTMDGDEYVTQELAVAIRREIAKPNAPDAFQLWWKTPYPPTLKGADWSLHPRLVRADKCQWQQVDNPHSWLDTRGLKMGRIDTGHVDHEPISDLPSTLRKSINRALVSSALLRKSGKKTHAVRALFSALGRFLHTYFRRGAWRYGSSGLIIAVADGFEGFCKYAFLYEHRDANEAALLDGGKGSYPEGTL